LHEIQVKRIILWPYIWCSCFFYIARGWWRLRNSNRETIGCLTSQTRTGFIQGADDKSTDCGGILATLAVLLSYEATDVVAVIRDWFAALRLWNIEEAMPQV
jgi:hypothetical protein